MLPVLFGISGKELTAEERELFRAFLPYGFILFRRNIDTPEQTKALTASLRELTGRADTPILIDQEGGRVQRLRPPHWADLPNLQAIGELYEKNKALGIDATKLQAQAIAGMLTELGFNVVCAPVMDVPVAGAHDVIGDRAFSQKPSVVATLATVMAQEFLNCGITPIMKHIPGHGRADADSHYACPVVSADRDELNKTDFLPFKTITQTVTPEILWAMTAHVVFPALDEEPVSVSTKAIKVLRQELGVKGCIIPDAIEMEALGGTLADRALATLKAGCDLTMHCSGKLEDMKAIAAVLPPMTNEAKQRLKEAEAARQQGHKKIDWRDAVERLQSLLTIENAETYKPHEALTIA